MNILTTDEKNPTRGLQGQTARPNLRWGEEVQGPERSGPHTGWGSVAPLPYKVTCLSTALQKLFNYSSIMFSWQTILH